MIINKNTATVMYNKIEETKEISKLSFEQAKFDRYCHTLNKIAAINYKVRMFGDFEISMFKVLPCMSQLVIPRKISFGQGEEWADFRADSYKEYKPEKYGFDAKIEALDADEFNSITKGIAGSRKKSIEGTELSVYSCEGSYEEVKMRVADLTKGLSESFVALQADYFVPVDFKFLPYKEDFYTMKAEVNFRMWFENALNNIDTK